ncbi:enoyl- hydratase protein [Rutstroemia sp. NJR-2017a BBW]|nr:enoyl- hydratase protein [Rutstroemia sp. NJR-2017a BBW]
MTNLPQITIAAVNGIARGGGNEFLVSLDMRFAAKPHTLLGQPEVGLGVVPGGGGSQYLSRLIGRGRAMEYILSAKDINAEDAERIGWINQAFDTEKEMPPLNETLEDANRFLQTISTPAAQSLIAKVLKASANESAGDVELYLGELIPSFYS